jgi:hypothetical protein
MQYICWKDKEYKEMQISIGHTDVKYIVVYAFYKNDSKVYSPSQYGNRSDEIKILNEIKNFLNLKIKEYDEAKY